LNLYIHHHPTVAISGGQARARIVARRGGQDMGAIPTIGEQEIRQRVGDRSFQLGRSYYRDGAISGGRRQGTTLKALCRGSRPQPYRVEVTFADSGISDADCSCPVGDGGCCKHVAAMLLTWLARPESFVEVEALDASLERRDKPELIALVKQMLRRHPDLETLLELPLAAGKLGAPVSAEAYRREAEAIIEQASGRGYDYDGSDEADVAGQLMDLTAMGDGFAAQGDYANAAAVYQAVAGSVADNYDELSDEEGQIGAVIRECVERLGMCLSKAEDSALRSGIFKALFAIYTCDVDYGGQGFSDGIPSAILSYATTDERALVADWIRAALRQATDELSDWARDTLGGFLLDLLGDSLDDESFLRICRETGRLGDIVSRLLALGRLDEAVQAASGAGDYTLLSLADIFVGRGHDEVAERLIAERADSSGDVRLPDWLRDRFRAREDWESALAYADRGFRHRVALERYQDVRELARRVGRWQALRPELIGLMTAPGHWPLLIQVFLDEGEYDLAIDALKDPAHRAYANELALEVAGAVSATRPRAALEIYQQEAERAVGRRNRSAYAEACELLARVREIHRDLGEESVWSDYILELRVRYRTLRALKEELSAAGL
jgi:tetratricopeptide (TPR) repeat protein